MSENIIFLYYIIYVGIVKSPWVEVSTSEWPLNFYIGLLSLLKKQ